MLVESLIVIIFSQFQDQCYFSDPNPAFSPAFEEFARDLVIDDPYDQVSCSLARSKLNFEPDHPHDTEVCQEFEEFMCDGVFDVADDEADLLSRIPSYGHFEYTTQT